MDRRAFLSMSGSLAAAATMKNIPLDTTDPKVAKANALLASFFQQKTDGPITVKVSSEFMEDYTDGALWTGSTEKLEVQYKTRDGRLVLYSFSGPDSGTGSGQANNTLDLLLPDPESKVAAGTDPDMASAADSMTGWSRQQFDMLQPGGRIAGAVILPQPITGGAPVGRVTDTSTHVQYEPNNQVADTLVVTRDGALQITSLADDGTPGRWIQLYTKTPSRPMLSGQLPFGSQYLPEYQYNPPNQAGYPVGMVFRDIFHNRIIQVDSNNLFKSTDAENFQEIYPVNIVPYQTSFCFIAVEKSGLVWAIRMQLDNPDAPDATFHMTRKIGLGTATGGWVYVNETSPGQMEVFLIQIPTPNNSTTPAQILTIPVTFGANGAISLGASSATPIPQFHMPKFADGSVYRAKGTLNKDRNAVEIFLLIQEPPQPGDGVNKFDPLTEMWSIARNKHGHWEAPMIIDKGLRNVQVFAAADEVTLAVQRPRTAYEIWTRADGGDWNTDHIRLESENATFDESAGYRVGVTFLRDGNPFPAGEIGMLASVSVPAVVSGRHATLGIHRPWHAACDHTGTLWITVLLEDRINFPDLILTSPFFSDRLVLDLNHKIEGFLGNVTSDQLMKARDPRRCTDLETAGCSAAEVEAGLVASGARSAVSDPDKAQKAAYLISETVKAAPKPDILKPSTVAPVTVQSSIPWGWYPVSAPLAALRPVLDPARAPSWQLTRRNGKAHLEIVSAEVARADIERSNALYPAYTPRGYAGPFDWFTDLVDDIVDGVGDLAKAAYDGVAEIVKVTVNGLTMVANLVIDGVAWVYNVVLDTIDMVMDALDFLLEYAGMAIGMAVGWLLEQLGFLFDWKAIKRQRDRFKNDIRTNLGPVLTRLGDPIDGAAKIKSTLDSTKVQVYSALDSIRSSPVDQKIFDGGASDGPDLSSLSFLGGASLMPQITWLLDKVQAVLPRTRGGLADFNLPGLDDLLDDFFKLMAGFGSSIISILNDILQLLNQWVVNGKLFTAAAFDPLLDFLKSLVGRLFDMLKGVIDAGAKLLHALWAGASSFLDWLDAALPLPAMFRGFYKGLMGNAPSFFDIACLVAAIPVAIGMNIAEMKTPTPTEHREVVVAAHEGQPRYLDGLGAVVPTARIRDTAFHPNDGSLGWMESAKSGSQNRRVSRADLGDPVSFARFAAGAAGPPTKDPKDSPIGIGSIVFSSLGCVTTAITSGITAMTPDKEVEKTLGVWPIIFTGINMTMAASFHILELAHQNEYPHTKKAWEALGIAGLVGVAATGFALLYKYRRRSAQVFPVGYGNAPVESGSVLQYVLCGVQFIGFNVALHQDSPNAVLSSLISTLQSALAIIVANKRPVQPIPAGGIAYGIIQGALSGVTTYLYADNPIPETA